MTKDAIREVLDFWFDEASEPHWFKPSAAFDEVVRQRLATLQMRAAAGELDDWRASAEGCVALCVLLDQASRQLFRGSSRAFATDESTLAIAEHALANGFERQLPLAQRQFLYLPFMHSERLECQLRCVELYEAPELRDKLVYAEEHADIIRRFGRFPHSNAALGRVSTAAEQAYLRESIKDFGQVAPPPEARGEPGQRE
jgi:uncharacterized protein (DUF924 family)